MPKVRTPYLKLDENILGDPKIEALIESEGLAGLGVYIGLLTLFRKYEDTDYMIDFSKISLISKKYFGSSEKSVKKIVDDCLEIGLFEQFQSNDGKRFFFSSRRKRDLIEQKGLRQKQHDSAEETNRKLGRGLKSTV